MSFKGCRHDPALRPWHLVADEFNRRHGTTLTRTRIQQIAKVAMKKMHRQLTAQDREQDSGRP